MRSRRSVILDVCVQAEFHTLLLISLYLLFAGHNQPGGGFAGGLVAAAAFSLRYAAGGERAVQRSVSVAPTTFLGFGLLLAVVTGAVSLALGHDFLESAKLSVDLPVIGEAYTTSVIFFDTGVYLVVLGTVLMLLEQLGLSTRGDSNNASGDSNNAAGDNASNNNAAGDGASASARVEKSEVRP